jgi:hypothetical protein
MALGRHRAERLWGRVCEELEAVGRLGLYGEESGFAQPPALARTIGLDKREVHHHAASSLDGLLYVEHMARAHKARRQGCDASQTRAVENQPPIRAPRLDRVHVAGLLVADGTVPLNELIKRQLVVDLQRQAPSLIIRGHQRPSEAIRGHQKPSEVIRGH